MKKHRWLLALFVMFAGIYILQTFVIPSDQSAVARYKLSYSTTQILRLSVFLPIMFVWAMALKGYIKLDKYATLLADSREYYAWRNIARGVLIMALSLPLSAIVSNMATSIYHNNPSLTPKMVIINNYIMLTILSAAILFFYRGARHLYAGPVVKRDRWSYGPLYLLVFLLISSMFVYLNLTNEARQFPTSSASVAAYYLPDWLLMTTVLIPYVWVMYAGIKSVEFIHAYRRYATGSIYKSSLRSLAIGLALVISSWIAQRFLLLLITAFDTFALQYLLAVIYCLIFLIGFGYTLIARGATKLTKIEEV